MSELDFGVSFDALSHETSRPIAVEPSRAIERKVRNHSVKVAGAYALASAVAALVAVAVAERSGPVVWWSVGYVAAVLLLEFLTLQSYERTRSLRPVKHLVTLAGMALLAATVAEVLNPAEVRGASFVVGSAGVVVAGAVVVRKLTRAPRSTLLVGDVVGVGHFIRQWVGRSDIDMRGICLAESGDDASSSPTEIMGVPVLGVMTSAPKIAVGLAVDEVVVAPGPILTAYDVRRMSWALEDSLIELTVAAEVHGAVPHRIQPRVLGKRLLLSVRPGKRPRLALWAKGAIDRVGALALIAVLSPVFLVVAAAIKVGSPGPVLFRQTRAGLDGKPFTMYKFRTMVVDAESLLAGLISLNEGSGPLFKLANDPRVTRMGSFLRHTSLDELPQLFNVVKGNMSLIGPRPGLPAEAATYDEWIRHRLRVKPGMTGAWQVSGRSNLSWQESVRLDIDYVDNWTLRDDLSIAARTARAVLKRDGAH